MPFLVFCFASIWLFEWPNNPYRGSFNHRVDWWALRAAIIFTVVLIWTVFDATRLCNWLIRKLMVKETDWPEEVLKQAASELGVGLWLLNPKDNTFCGGVKSSLEQYADVTFLSERTAVVARRVYDAAIACLLLFLARSPFFDQYVMSWSMILIFAMALAVVFVCGACLRCSAREAKRKGRQKVSEALYHMRSLPGRGPTGDRVMPELGAPVLELSAFRTEGAALELVHATGRVQVVDRPARSVRRRSQREEAVRALKRIDRALDQIKTGAFSKLIDDPFLRALFLILAGFGALLSLEPIRILLQRGG